MFFHDGTWSTFRGRSHGRPVDPHRVPADRFVGYLQNHDQIGNRADRRPDRLPRYRTGWSRSAPALVLTAPFTPMLFMGEEWGAGTPWQYFTDHPEPELAAAVAEAAGREFAAHGWAADGVPDPQDPATFARSKLDWDEPRAGPPRASLLDWYRELIALRRARPELTDPRLGRVQVDYDELERWLVVRRGRLRVVANLGPGSQRVPLDRPAAAVLAASGPGVAIGQDVITMPGHHDRRHRDLIAVGGGSGAGGGRLRAGKPPCFR